MPNIILAKKAGFCFGVKRAVDEALNCQKEKSKKIYTLGPLIHNKDVVSELEGKDIHSITMEDINMLQKDDVIVIRSHGVSKATMDLLKERHLDIVDASCPYVKHIHNIVQKYYEDGYQVVIIGDENHPEVIGINGWCNNSAIILNQGEVKTKLARKVCVVCQTTERQENFKRAINSIAEECKEFVVFNTICSATEERQKSAAEIAGQVDIMIVVGDKTSSNTNKLYEICKNKCDKTFHIENHLELNKFFHKDLDISNMNIGITAGASTPDNVINEVISKLKGDVCNG